MSQVNPSGLPQNAGLSDNAAGAIAYITIIPAVIFLLVDPFKARLFVRFHAWQSLFLFVAALVINLVLGIVLGLTLMFMPYMHYTLMRLIDLLWLAVFIICVIQAANGKMFKLPVVGAIAEQLANK